jgi:methyltransferase (TIGR00027 family)
LIDDWIKDDLEVGLRQLVILGAGFDCRAVRLPISSDLEIFEIDRKPVIDVKEFLLAGCVTRPVKRLPMDFQNDDLSEVLRDAGFNCDLKTLFIWEGVTNYLDQTSVHGVFNFIGRNAKPGSRLVFTYVDAKAVAGDFDAPGLSRLLEDLQELGEPWTFGIHPENVSEQLRSCGLKLCEDLDAATYRQRFGITDSGYEFYHAVLSEVADAPGKA